MGALLALGGCIGGFYLASNSWGGTVVVHSSYFSDRRSPAAIRRVFDFSHLDGSALRLASQKRLVTDARVILADSKVGLELGHFVTKAADGSRLFACEFYDRITLSFEAEGVAENGEKAILKVDGPCAMGDDLNRMAPIWLPTGRFAREKSTDMELTYAESEGVSFKFENMPTAWPHSWILTSIRVFNAEEAGREISISQREMREMSDHPIRVVW